MNIAQVPALWLEFALALLYGCVIWAVLFARRLETRQVTLASLLWLTLIVALCLGLSRVLGSV